MSRFSFDRLRSGNELEFSGLFDAMYDKLILFSLRFLGDEDSAADLVQDVFYKLWDMREELPEDGNPEAYLYKIVRNKALNVIRHGKVKSAHKSMYSGNTVNNVDAQNELQASEIRDIIARSLEEMPDQQRRIFEASRILGKTYADIAQEENKSIKTIEANMSKALAKLRTDLGDYYTIAMIIFAAGIGCGVTEVFLS